MVRIISALILAVTAVCASAADKLELVDNPPDRHVVVKGDTLWAISGKFLKQPWRWPEIWQMNRSEIKNPHWIYPGDIIVLDMSSGTPRLRKAKRVGAGPAGKGSAQPTVYSEAIQQVIPSVPPGEIEPFISQPLIIDSQDLNTGVRMVASQEDRILVGTGDQFYATGVPDASIEKWQIFRKGKPLKDPETDQVIAYEAFFLGNARLEKPGEPATMRVTMAKEEIGRGSYLRPAPETQIVAYVPHRPEQPVSARIMSIYGGLNEGGVNSVVSINRGTNDGIEVGHVLAMFRKRTSIDVNEETVVVETPVPEERYGLVFVFRVFDRVAYGLVVDSSKAVKIGDAARNP